jgi:hypothetical protein
MKKNENFQIGYKHNAWTYFKPIKEHWNDFKTLEICNSWVRYVVLFITNDEDESKKKNLVFW